MKYSTKHSYTTFECFAVAFLKVHYGCTTSRVDYVFKLAATELYHVTYMCRYASIERELKPYSVSGIRVPPNLRQYN